VLHARTLLRGGGLEVCDVRCRHEQGAGATELHSGRHAVVFVRRGCFVRRADGRDAVLDPTRAYTMVPGEEHRYDHPHGDGDDCTALFLDGDLLADVPELPRGAVPTTPDVDLAHRRMLAAVRRGDDPDEALEPALALVFAVLADVGSAPTARSTPARRRLADAARSALAADTDVSLVELARQLAVSPHHLSRVFRAETGETVARHRMRLRARRALEALAEGEHDLARLAADTGFADQSHLCRVLRSETGTTPSALRTDLS
jgi:AraC-like DNA-binding protein